MQPPMNHYKQCPRCGRAYGLQEPVCTGCGHRFSTEFQTPPQPNYNQGPNYNQTQGFYNQLGYQQPINGQKSFLVAILLAVFVGGFGVHRFYLGHTNTAITMLVLHVVGVLTACIYVGFFLLAIVWVWAIVDIIMIATGSLGDASGMPLSRQ